jgi:hypothetical protein
MMMDKYMRQMKFAIDTTGLILYDKFKYLSNVYYEEGQDGTLEAYPVNIRICHALLN